MFSFRKLGFCVLSLQLAFSGMENVGLGQTVKDIFRDKEIKLLDNFVFFDLRLMNSNNLLGLSNEQQEKVKERFAMIDALYKASQAASEIQAAQEEPHQAPKITDFEAMKWVEFMSMLNDEQNLKLTQYLLVHRVKLLALRECFPFSNCHYPLQSLIFCSEFANWLGVTDEQNKRLQKAKREARLAWENLPKDLPAYEPEAAEAKLFVQWQETLHELLLPHQQSSYKEALGTEAVYLKKYFIVSKAKVFLLDPSYLNSTVGVIIDPREQKIELGHLLNLTSPHLDAKIHPYALYDLLLTKDVTKDLKLNEAQVDQLTRMRDHWFKENPLNTQETIRIEEEMGLKMTTQAMRERAKQFEEKFGDYHDQIEQVLSLTQRERLRQLGNQFLMSRGWLEVPLSCPEWLDYLELTQDQRSKFEQVNAQFRLGHERMEWEMGEPFKQIERDLEEKISQILTEKQIESLLEFKAIIE